MSDVQIAAVGNAVTDVRYSVTDTGVPLASFRMAVTPRKFDRAAGRWVDGDSSFYTVTCWRALADNVASSVVKGDPLCVVGRLRVRNWEKDGTRGTAAEVDASAVGHDLGRGTSVFRRTRRLAADPADPGGTSGSGSPAGEARVNARTAPSPVGTGEELPETAHAEPVGVG